MVRICTGRGKGRKRYFWLKLLEFVLSIYKNLFFTPFYTFSLKKQKKKKKNPNSGTFYHFMTFTISKYTKFMKLQCLCDENSLTVTHCTKIHQNAHQNSHIYVYHHHVNPWICPQAGSKVLQPYKSCCIHVHVLQSVTAM